MKTLRLLAMFCATLLLCNSCLKGTGEDEQQNNNNNNNPETGLELTATPSTITADGEDAAVLKVTFNDEVLTTGFTIYDDKDQPVELENMEFRTTTAGKYKFWAAYKSYNSETITITAEEPENDTPEPPQGPEDSDPENINFKRRVLLIQFTGTGCGYCPGMSAALKECLQYESFADSVVLTAAHRYNSSDPAYLANYALD